MDRTQTAGLGYYCIGRIGARVWNWSCTFWAKREGRRDNLKVHEKFDM